MILRSDNDKFSKKITSKNDMNAVQKFLDCSLINLDCKNFIVKL